MREILTKALGLISNAAPFPWQERLLHAFLEGSIPTALDIPTGLGKTSVMAIWLAARAAGAPVPRRLVYVVDRRAVVDQATDVAMGLRTLVDQNPEFKQALCLTRSLPISTLRGQFVDNREWLEDPSLPAIVVGTVDMIGSRLLFSGYGVSRKMRPYHAGFLGADSLIVLDEAHLVQPFERMLEQVASGRDADGRTLRPQSDIDALVPRLQVLSLSATGRDRVNEDVLRLNDEDRAHPIVQKRLGAFKRATLRPEVSKAELPDSLAAEAWALSKEGMAPVRIIIFCNSRDCAQKVQKNLEDRAPKGDNIDTELFVGGRRVHERNLVAKWLCERGFIAGEKVALQRPTFVVATSAGEVGVDLDADHAVCDLVAWERMVQRFGRVNRRGEGRADIVVIPQILEKDDDQGGTSRRESLLRLFEQLPPIENDEGLDVSPGALVALKKRPELQGLIQAASTPARLHPPLTRALIESWSMTSLEEHTGRPQVEPWIRGWPNPDEEDKPQTTVVWREELPLKVEGEKKTIHLLEGKELEAFRDTADPHTAEKLETETWRVLDWLRKRIKKVESGKNKPSIAEDVKPARHTEGLRAEDIVAVILDSRSENISALRGKDLLGNRKRLERTLANATLIVDRRLGGLQSGLLAHDEDDFAEDVTTSGHEAFGSPSGGGAKNPREVPFRIRYVLADQSRAPDKGWRTEAVIPVEKSGDEIHAWLLVESVVSQAASSEEGRSGALCNQLLEIHEEWVESDARAIAERLKLPAEYSEVLAAAARLHDEGKKATCWQRAFNAPRGGNPPYAKTTGRPRLSILGKYRHELGSLPYAETHTRVQALSPELRRLCLRLIVAHHGFARPLIRIDGATEPPIRLRKRTQNIALEFSALEKQWGPWGLAWWESLLRAADQRASRRNDESRDDGSEGYRG